jgi:DNA-binding transcriptional ArsR family regulator
MLARIFASKRLHMLETRRDVFQAIADPTRRQIIGMVANGSLNLNAIAEKFDVSRQAVSLHVKILEECGLIVIEQQGRERYCEANLRQLNEVAAWVDQYRQFWTDNFNALDKYLAKIQNKKTNAKRKPKK